MFYGKEIRTVDINMVKQFQNFNIKGLDVPKIMITYNKI